MISTPRLLLRPATIELLDAAMLGPQALADALRAEVPDDWPPEYLDDQALGFTRNRLSARPAENGWWMYFVVRIEEGQEPKLIGSGGYKGPPDADGTIEIGYGIVPGERRRGYATEVARGLVDRALAHPGTKHVIAETMPELLGSIGVLERCGFRLVGGGSEPGVIRYELPADAMLSAMDQTTLRALADFPGQLAAHFALIPVEYRSWKPQSWDGMPSEQFTAVEQLCHVRDIEVDGYHERIRRVRDEEHPTLASLDGERLAVERAYSKARPEQVLAEIRKARLKTLELIHGLTPAQLERTGEFGGYGTLTLRSLIHYLCSHDQQHLSGLQWLCGKIGASKVATSPKP